MLPTSRTVHEGEWRGTERRSGGPIEERVTRVEEQLSAMSRELAGQAIRDRDMHQNILRLIEKQDERMDREHDERLQLTSQLQNLVSRVAIVGGVIVVAANILAPLAIKLLVP